MSMSQFYWWWCTLVEGERNASQRLMFPEKSLQTWCLEKASYSAGRQSLLDVSYVLYHDGRSLILDGWRGILLSSSGQILSSITILLYPKHSCSQPSLTISSIIINCYRRERYTTHTHTHETPWAFSLINTRTMFDYFYWSFPNTPRQPLHPVSRPSSSCLADWTVPTVNHVL